LWILWCVWSVAVREGEHSASDTGFLELSAFIAILIHVSKELIYRTRCTLPVEDHPNVQTELEINNASFVSELDSSFRPQWCSLFLNNLSFLFTRAYLGITRIVEKRCSRFSRNRRSYLKKS
jgi:hypothetical protein